MTHRSKTHHTTMAYLLVYVSFSVPKSRINEEPSYVFLLGLLLPVKNEVVKVRRINCKICCYLVQTAISTPNILISGIFSKEAFIFDNSKNPSSFDEEHNKKWWCCAHSVATIVLVPLQSELMPKSLRLKLCWFNSYFVSLFSMLKWLEQLVNTVHPCPEVWDFPFFRMLKFTSKYSASASTE